MFIVRSLFWIICVSLLLAGGNDLSGSSGGRSEFRYVNSQSPAYHSAERVVASLSRLDGWCRSHEKVCQIAGSAGHLVLELVDGGMRMILSSDAVARPETALREGSDAAAAFTRRAAEKISDPETILDTSLFDGITDLLYDEGEELDDFG